MDPRKILFVVYDGFELLDLAGPMTVFTTANELSGQRLYDVQAVAEEAQSTASCGLSTATVRLDQVIITGSDTVIIVGAYKTPLLAAASNPALREWIVAASLRAERFGSVCSGAFVLGAAGLLRGEPATTHWAAADRFRALYPDVRLDADALYVRSGRVWTSAGVTTGIDMALAMLSEDHGPSLMGRVARYLVVYSHRPGSQSQFSRALEVQTVGRGDFSDLVAWLSDRMDRPVTVTEMANRVGLSERTFLRKFTAQTGVSPAKFLSRLRVDRARSALESGFSVKETVSLVGFQSESAFRTMFLSYLGVTPTHYVQMHGTNLQASHPTTPKSNKRKG